MTSRSIDIKCIGCRKYLFSIGPNEHDEYELNKIHHCEQTVCKEKATVETLKGPPPSMTKEEMFEILDNLGKRFRRMLPANQNNFKTIIFEKKKHSEFIRGRYDT